MEAIYKSLKKTQKSKGRDSKFYCTKILGHWQIETKMATITFLMVMDVDINIFLYYTILRRLFSSLQSLPPISHKYSFSLTSLQKLSQPASTRKKTE
jgi:hypothetical protein